MATTNNGGHLIDLDSGWENVVLKDRDKCSKVVFDAKQIKILSKEYTVYGIPRNEHILAFCKGNVPLVALTVEGIIFTNQAVYFYPYKRKYKGTEINYIPYEHFDSVIFYQNGSRGEVFAQTRTDETRLLGPSLISKNVAGLEVLIILCRIQKELFNRNFLASDNYKAVVSAVIEGIREEMGIEPLSHKYDSILNQLMRNPLFQDEAIMLKAEYLFREFNTRKYNEFVSANSKLIHPSTVSKLKPIPSEFYRRYIRFLTDMEQELTYTTLSKISENIDDLENSTINDKIVQIYLNIRMNEHDSVRRSVYALRLKYGSALVEPIEWFHCIYCYHMMEKVYSTIIAKSDISTQYYRCVDGVGLTPLHYAIILKNDRAVKILLKNTSWGIPSPYPCTKEFSRMYDYEILGCGKQVDSIHDLLQKFNENVIDIVQMEKTLKTDLRFKNVAYAIQKTNLTAYHLEYAREMANQSRRENISDISERIDNLREIVDSTKESIEDIESVLMECDDLLIAAMEDAICSNLEFLEQAQKSKDPITRYLYRLYFEPDFLSRVITAVKNREDLRMYRYHSFYFVAPGFAIIDMPYQTQPNNNRDFFTQDDSREPRNNEEIPKVPLFGTSWFSPEAHHNIGVLKSEYRKLAKKYHPDSNYEAGSNHLFSEISQEYQSIQSSM